MGRPSRRSAPRGRVKKEVEGVDILVPASMIRHAELRCGEREA